jgi:hypothetical protein
MHGLIRRWGKLFALSFGSDAIECFGREDHSDSSRGFADQSGRWILLRQGSILGYVFKHGNLPLLPSSQRGFFHA